GAGPPKKSRPPAPPDLRRLRLGKTSSALKPLCWLRCQSWHLRSNPAMPRRNECYNHADFLVSDKEQGMGIQFRELWSWVRPRKIFASLLVALTLCVGIVIGASFSGHALANRAQGANGASLLAVPDPVSLSGAFAKISKSLGPAVVNISTTQVIEKPKGGHAPHGQNDPFQDFFDRFFNSPDNAPDAERSLGSGVL